MATGDVTRAAGTTITWTSSGGDYAFTMSSIADAAGQTAKKGDLGTPRATLYVMEIVVKSNVAPTAGGTYDIYWCNSRSVTDATDNAGNGDFTGSDAAFTVDTNSLADLDFITSVVCSADATTVFRKFVEFVPQTQWGFPVFVNNSGQTTGTTGTDHHVKIYPQVLNATQ